LSKFHLPHSIYPEGPVGEAVEAEVAVEVAYPDTHHKFSQSNSIYIQQTCKQTRLLDLYTHQKQVHLLLDMDNSTHPLEVERCNQYRHILDLDKNHCPLDNYPRLPQSM
jgi:hypothetical protein